MRNTKPDTKPRLSIGSLQGMSARQLAVFKAEVCNTLDARWRRDNLTRSRGRPSEKDRVVAACTRIQGKMRRQKKATLGDWYEAVAEELQFHGLALSVPTIKKFTRPWMCTYLPLTAQPVEIGPYLINAQKDFSGVQWILIWGALCEEFPDVQRWLKDRQRQSVPLLGELPHAILPKVLQDKINSRSDFPLGPRLYDHLVRKSLRSAPRQ